MNQKTEDFRSDLENLIERYGNTILRFCYLYLLDLEQAQQALQDVFVKAYKDRDFQEQRLDKKKLLRITVRQCRRQLFLRKGRPVVSRRSLIGVFNDMTPLEREIMLLHHYMELSEKDISFVCTLPLLVIRRTISKADQAFAKHSYHCS